MSGPSSLFPPSSIHLLPKSPGTFRVLIAREDELVGRTVLSREKCWNQAWLKDDLIVTRHLGIARTLPGPELRKHVLASLHRALGPFLTPFHESTSTPEFDMTEAIHLAGPRSHSHLVSTTKNWSLRIVSASLLSAH